MKEHYQAIEAFHEKFKMKGTNNEDMNFRLNLMVEELGELSAAVTKGKSKKEFIAENIDILILVLGNFISMGVSFEEIDKKFWEKHKKIMSRKKRIIGGRNFRVSEFRNQ